MGTTQDPYRYNCLQCDVPLKNSAEAKAHMHNEGHEVEQEYDDDIEDPYYDEDR